MEQRLAEWVEQLCNELTTTAALYDTPVQQQVSKAVRTAKRLLHRLRQGDPDATVQAVHVEAELMSLAGVL